MLIVGAKGHATEVLDILKEKYDLDRLFFFDNMKNHDVGNFFGFPIIDNYEKVANLFLSDKRFYLALGGTLRRKCLVLKMNSLGGELCSIISKRSYTSCNSKIGKGVNIMSFSSVYGDAVVGEGVLLNSYASIHHGSNVGIYTEISPGARILGNCKIGKSCSIGTNATILPNISITDNTIVGAGSVITKNIEIAGTYVGVPAKRIK
tara:strand:- start:10225 stop:10842 length:618 start_codon:yes stop_codon:yes gene_type:complete